MRGADSAAFDKPFRPLPIAIANRVGTWLARVGIGDADLTVDALMSSAARQTGLSDFGDERFVEALGVLLRSINEEAKLSPVGRAIIRGRLTGILSNKLRTQAALSVHPEILDTELQGPIVIAGLQRTGTTMLHRLISQDPRIRSLASWEALNPAPLKSRLGKRDPRVRQAVLAEKGVAYMAPEFFAIHPIEAEAPEEEIILLDQSFLSTSAEATMNVPSYASWLEQQDHVPAYQALKQMLQFLQWQRPGERWVLKTPHHLEFLDPLLEVFPDATVVQTHRDPLKTSASFFSMVTHARAIFSDEVDPHAVAEHWLRKLGRMVGQAMRTRDRVKDQGFVDVSYYDLMKDPVLEVRRIYETVGWDLPDSIRAKMEASRRLNRKDRHGRHNYALEDFGMSRQDVEPVVAEYRARFQVPFE
jgi:hypothetical protein